jgi:hypothetical protein
LATPGSGIHPVFVFSLADFLRLSLYFDFVFGGATVLLWWLGRGRRSTMADLVIAWVVAILSVFTAYWLADKTGLELLSMAGLFFAAYFACLGIASVPMKWDAPRFIATLVGTSILISIGLSVLDYNCGVNHWSVPTIKLVC